MFKNLIIEIFGSLGFYAGADISGTPTGPIFVVWMT